MVVEIYVYLILVSNYFYVNEGHLITRSPTDPEKFHVCTAISEELTEENLFFQTI